MIILDTCSLLWLVTDQKSLSAKARSSIQKSSGNIYISSISAFEIAVKFNKGKIKLPMSPNDWYHKALELHGIIEISISGEIAMNSASLPVIHQDPADRIIIATAQHHHLKIITPDERISAYEEARTIWY